MADLGSNFLERLGDQSTGGLGRAWRSNPGGGGASEAAQGPLFRSWGEAYGITVQGIGESRYGADTGASASVSLSNTARVYLNYDGKFRAALQSHQGAAGLELRW